jgi:predicted DsbA family dithiol-disulfide isomerase
MPRSRELILFFDYVDPASFLLESRLRGLISEEGPSLIPEPLEIRPPPEPLLDPEDGGWRDRWDSMARLGERLGVELKRPWIVPWTRKAHELAVHAKDNGCFRDIHDALFRAYLQEGRDIGRVDVLVEIGRSGGLDPGETKAVLDVDRNTQAVEEGRVRAAEMGILRVPTLWIDGRMLADYQEDEALRGFLESDSA